MTTIRARPGLDVRHLAEGYLLVGLSKPRRQDGSLVGVSRPGGGPITYTVHEVHPDKVVVLAPGVDERSSCPVADEKRRLIVAEYPIVTGHIDTRNGRISDFFPPGHSFYDNQMPQVMEAHGVST